MNINHLRYFLAIAKHENISRASEELRIAQSALSVCLSRMEEELGVPLFEHDKKKIYLNDYGRIFQKSAADILLEYDNALDELLQIKNEKESRIRIGVADWGFPRELLAQFPSSHPEFQVSIDLCYVPDSESLLESLYDAVISPLPTRLAECCCVPLRKSKVYVLVSKEHPLADHNNIALKELEHATLWLPGYNSQFGWYMQQLLAEQGVHLASIHGCVTGVLPQLLTSTTAISLIVPEMFDRVPGGLPNSVRMIPVAPALYRETGIIFTRKKQNRKSIRCFCSYMQKKMEELPI